MALYTICMYMKQQIFWLLLVGGKSNFIILHSLFSLSWKKLFFLFHWVFVLFQIQNIPCHLFLCITQYITTIYRRIVVYICINIHILLYYVPLYIVYELVPVKYTASHNNPKVCVVLVINVQTYIYLYIIRPFLLKFRTCALNL